MEVSHSIFLFDENDVIQLLRNLSERRRCSLRQFPIIYLPLVIHICEEEIGECHCADETNYFFIRTLPRKRWSSLSLSTNVSRKKCLLELHCNCLPSKFSLLANIPMIINWLVEDALSFVAHLVAKKRTSVNLVILGLVLQLLHYLLSLHYGRVCHYPLISSRWWADMGATCISPFLDTSLKCRVRKN